MKNKYLVLIIVTAMITMLVACRKKDHNIGGSQTGWGYGMQVKVDGTVTHFSDVTARWIDGGNYLEITGTNDGTEWISITIMSETTRVPTGQYSLDDGSAFTILSVYSHTDGNARMNYTATRGTLAPEDAFVLHIDRINDEVEGSFSGSVVMVEGIRTLGIVTLEEGQFKAPIRPN